MVIHPLTDNRRVLPLEKKGELVHAHPDFQIVISYNPGYQSLMKDLKQSTKQRFGGLDFTYPDHAIETEIVDARVRRHRRHRRQAGVDRRALAATSRAMASTKACRPAC